MLHLTCEEFLTQLSTKQPVPGGGGASALCGALGVALGSMVCNLTRGKKKYAAVEEDILRILKEGEELRLHLQSLVQADADAFEPLSQAYGLPKTTAEEAAKRQEVMEKCLKDACQVPLHIMEACTKAIALLEELAEKGSRIALSDVGVGAAFCRAALDGASLNVYINTKLMQDRETAAQWEEAADAMLKEWLPRADQVVEAVKGSIRK